MRKPFGILLWFQTLQWIELIASFLYRIILIHNLFNQQIFRWRLFEMFLRKCIYLLAFVNYMGSTSSATRSNTTKTTTTAEASDEGNGPSWRNMWKKLANKLSKHYWIYSKQ